MPQKDEQKLFSVELRKHHDSAYLFRCENPDAAAGLYLKDVIDGVISVDPETVHDLDELVIREMPGKEGAPGRLQWEDIPNIYISAGQHPVWMDAISQGFDPESGNWHDNGADLDQTPPM